MDKQRKEEALDPSVDIKTCNLHTIRSSLETGVKNPKKIGELEYLLRSIRKYLSIYLSIYLSVYLYLYIYLLSRNLLKYFRNVWWSVTARIWKGEGWESRGFILEFYYIFFWKRSPMMFHLSYQNGGKPSWGRKRLRN